MIVITTVEHALAAGIHDLKVGAAATKMVVAKVLSVVEKDAPVVEAITTLVDPRIATLERVGEALLGQILPQVETAAGDLATEATTPSVTLTQELYAELKALVTQLGPEITAAKASVAVPAVATVAAA